MALTLGIDTGGTFTDAVLVADDGSGAGDVVAYAKAPTTHHDLTIGVAGAVGRVLDKAGSDAAGQIVLVSVSTTLATNALVEGHGEPAGLFTFGFSSRELERSGLTETVASDLIVSLDGGHDAHGNERVPLDLAAIEQAARERAPLVSAFAVAAQFSVRNPSHELAAAELIRNVTGLPVTSSHELSAKLDGPRRALTAALNARLLGTIDRLNQAVTAVLVECSIDAPLMVVRGDGSLVSAAFAGQRPIETVLSGPAASVVGALHLADLDSGLVVDIGGTTTDVAVITDGRPTITDGGAVVGGYRTMVEAVDMATVGLGGDSEVRIDTRDADGPLLLGPERALPVCRLAVTYPELHQVLDRQLAAPTGLTSHGRFLVSIASQEVALTDAREIEVLGRLSGGPVPEYEAATNGLEQRAAARLRARGLIRVATMTPTDASAILGSPADDSGGRGSSGVTGPGVTGSGVTGSGVTGSGTTALEVDRDAAVKVASILARQTNSTGGVLAADADDLAEQVVAQLAERSAAFVVRVALAADGVDHEGADSVIAASVRGHHGAAAVNISLSAPLTAIGAPAAAYYPAVAEQAGTSLIVPRYAHVANAIGAVVGRVRVRRSCTITQPTRGQYRVHLNDQPTFGSVDNARAAATELLQTAARHDAEAAGANTPEVTESWEQRVAVVGNKEVFVEGTLTIEASGRPRF